MVQSGRVKLPVHTSACDELLPRASCCEAVEKSGDGQDAVPLGVWLTRSLKRRSGS